MKIINKKNIFVFSFISIILCFFSIYKVIDNDLIWTYGFSYNISKNLIPYKDFNMVIGPLYSVLFSLPLKLFGNSLLIFKLSHILVFSLILTLIYNKLGKKTLLLILILTIQETMFWYNTFSAVLVLLILYLLDSNIKYKNILIGLIIGFILMTKHNIGLTLLLVYIITSKKKITSIVSASIPIIVTFLMLLITNSFWEYIDFCYLGLGNFLSNLYILPFELIFSIIILIYLIIEYKKEKDIKILYLIAFMIIVFPIIDSNHFITSLIPITYYILLKNEFFSKYIIIVFIVFGIISNIISLTHIEFISDDNFLKYNSVNKGVNNYLKEYSKYINKIEEEKYLFLTNAYLLKIYNNKTPNFYDLINKGNLGSNEKKYIKEIEKDCKEKNCIFILDSKYFNKKRKSQLIIDFKDYITKNYNYVETLPTNDKVYKNN